jgi:hypothetical protein
MQRFRYDFYGPGTYLAKSKVPLEPPIPASVWPRPPVLTGYVLIQIPPSLTGRVGVLGTPAPPKVLAGVKFGSVVRMARALDCCGHGNRPSVCCAHSGLDPEPRTCQSPGVLPPSPRQPRQLAPLKADQKAGGGVVSRPELPGSAASTPPPKGRGGPVFFPPGWETCPDCDRSRRVICSKHSPRVLVRV